MKLLSIYLIILFVFVNCQNKSNQYKDETLLYKYLEKHNFEYESFSLLFLRSKLLCNGCIPDHNIAINKVLSENVNQLYIIVDDSTYANVIDSLYGAEHSFKTIIENPENLSPYGLHQVHPHLFSLKKGKLIKWKMYN